MRRILFLLAVFLLLAPLPAQATIPVQEVKSPRGITAWLQEDDSLPIISIAFAWEGGFESDPEDRQGLSTLAAAMLTHGAGAYDNNAFQEQLEQNAISLEFEARRDSFRGSLRSLKETLPQAAKLLQASLTAPHFGKEALEREKNKQINTLHFDLADPDWLQLRLAMREGFKGHPYGNRALGNEASIKAITADDLHHWHKNLARENLVVAVSGNISPQELSALLDQIFGDLPQKSAATPIPEAGWIAGGKSFLLKLPGPQASALMIWPGLKRRDPEWYAAEVMDYILGGGSFSSRLMQEIREKRGLTYGVSSGQSPLKHAALFTVTASFQGKNAAEVLRLINEEVKKIIDTPVSSGELQAAKDYLIGSYPMELISTSNIAARLLSLRLDGLGMNEEEHRAAALRAVTAADVQKVAKKIFSAQPTTYMVGNPQGITPTASFDKLD